MRVRRLKARSSAGNIDQCAILDQAIHILKSHNMKEAANIISICLNTIMNPSTQATPPSFGLSKPQAIASIIDSNMSANAYIKLNRVLFKNGAKLFPLYKQLRPEFAASLPLNMSITETKCETTVQSLLDITSNRLCLAQNLDSSKSLQLTLISKWGLDGSGGHSLYKQLFATTLASDSNVLAAQLVPLRLYLNDHQKTIVWQNPAPNSNKLCRPI